MPSTEPLFELLSIPGRATRALVDLDALRDNVGRLKRHVGDEVELMAVVKADGYGHGAVMVAREAIAGGATWLGVATVAEGRELRGAGIATPILILGPIHHTEIPAATEHVLDVTVGDESLLTHVLAEAKAGSRVPRLHLKVDTGMHRYGLAPSEVLRALETCEAVSDEIVMSICSHFASADEPDALTTTRQLDVFREVLAQARAVRPSISSHIANSASSASGLATGTTIARTGIALYGCGLPDETDVAADLRPAMSIVSRLNRVHRLKAGDGVSYGHTYVASEDEHVGLVPIGYADGYPRSLSNVGWMSVGGTRAPIRGRVCMDQTVVGSLPESEAPDTWVGVAGPALDGPAWDDLASAAGTISYELLTRVGRRVARFYHRAGRLEAVRDEAGVLRKVTET